MTYEVAFDPSHMTSATSYEIMHTPDGLEIYLGYEVNYGGSIDEVTCVCLLEAAIHSGLRANREDMERIATSFAKGDPPNNLIGSRGIIPWIEGSQSKTRVRGGLANVGTVHLSPIGAMVTFSFLSHLDLQRAKPGQPIDGYTVAHVGMPPRVAGHFYLELVRALDEIEARAQVPG